MPMGISDVAGSRRKTISSAEFNRILLSPAPYGGTARKAFAACGKSRAFRDLTVAVTVPALFQRFFKSSSKTRAERIMTRRYLHRNKKTRGAKRNAQVPVTFSPSTGKESSGSALRISLQMSRAEARFWILAVKSEYFIDRNACPSMRLR